MERESEKEKLKRGGERGGENESVSGRSLATAVAEHFDDRFSEVGRPKRDFARGVAQMNDGIGGVLLQCVTAEGEREGGRKGEGEVRRSRKKRERKRQGRVGSIAFGKKTLKENCLEGRHLPR